MIGKSWSYVLVGFLALVFGVLFFLGEPASGISYSGDGVFLSPGEEGIFFLPSILVKLLPFIVILLAGIAVLLHLVFIRKKDRKKTTKFFDKIVYVIGILGPLAILPQVWIIWTTKNVGGISLISWGLISITDFSWLGYGIIHKYKPIIFTNVLILVSELVVVFGVLFYG